MMPRQNALIQCECPFYPRARTLSTPYGTYPKETNSLIFKHLFPHRTT